MILKLLYFIAIVFSICLILFIVEIIVISNDKAPLLGAIGIIISAFIASFSVLKSIESNKRLKEEEQNTKKYTELYYAVHILNKVEVVFTEVLSNINKLTFDYQNESLKQMQQDTKGFAEKLDSKELFSFLPKNETGKLMTIIARLSSTAHLIEIYINDKVILASKIEEQLVNHVTTFSLLPFTRDLIKYISQELEKNEKNGDRLN